MKGGNLVNRLTSAYTKMSITLKGINTRQTDIGAHFDAFIEPKNNDKLYNFAE